MLGRVKPDNTRALTMAQSYKALKEDFVSNLTGGSVSEINSVTAVAPVRTFCHDIFYQSLQTPRQRSFCGPFFSHVKNSSYTMVGRLSQ